MEYIIRTSSSDIVLIRRDSKWMVSNFLQLTMTKFKPLIQNKLSIELKINRQLVERKYCLTLGPKEKQLLLALSQSLFSSFVE